MIVEPSEDVEENFDDTSETEDGIDEGKIEYGIEDEIEEPEETESLPQDDGPW